jgi:tetratricopeptide (TPR) repeat protein
MAKAWVWRVALAIVLLCGFAGEAGAQGRGGRWLRAESDHFIVYSDTNERELRTAVQALEDYDATLRLIAQVAEPASPNKLEVYLVRRHATLRQVWPGMSRNIRGFYTATPEQVAMFVAYSDAGYMDRQGTLFHEYAHHFMLHYFPHAYPAWYVEGFAEYLSTMEIEGRRVIVGGTSTARSYSLHALGMLPIDALLASERVPDRSAYFMESFYSTAWFATLYIRNRPNYQQAMNRYVEALGEGADPLEAFEPAFGIPRQQFHDELREFLRGRIDRFAVRLADGAAPMTITRLDRSADELLLRVARLRMMAAQDEVDGRLGDAVDRSVAEFGDTRLGLIAQARVAMMRSDTAGARQYLERALSVDTNDVEARYLLANCIVLEIAKTENAEPDESQMRELRRLLAQNFRIDANHAPTLFLYAATFAGGPQPLNNEQLDVMARSLELAPQTLHIRLVLAYELMRAGEFNTAVAVLRPVAYAPHAPEVGAQARMMMDAARQGRMLTSWTPASEPKPELGEGMRPSDAETAADDASEETAAEAEAP